MQVTIDVADDDLSSLFEAVKSGAEVVIVADGQAIAKVVAMPKRRPFRYGIMKDVLKGPIPDFLEPLAEEELNLWEGGDEFKR